MAALVSMALLAIVCWLCLQWPDSMWLNVWAIMKAIRNVNISSSGVMAEMWRNAASNG